MRSMRVSVAVALALVVIVAGRLRAEDAAAPGFDPNVARRISVDELQKRMKAGEKPIILDTRGNPDVLAKGAQRVPNDKIEEWAKTAPKDRLIVAYCT